MATIAAAVVGVFLNLAIWFGLHVIFAEVAERQLLKVLGHFTWPLTRALARILHQA
ncbi:hypothetical protein [Halomonas sp. E19]|uniref:hypothetical protein n=1 Tax=Halomonas sp. E19 TaxID=3397247 RepID=UPI004033560B